MTAESVRQLAVSELQKKIVEGEKKLRQQLRYRPPSPIAVTGGIAAMPGNTAEEIGMVAVEVSAEIRTLEVAIDIVNEVYRTITSPTTPEESEGKQEQKKEKFYG